MSDKDSLILLHVIFRHGNRTPDAGLYFPKQIPINPNDYKPFGLGQLTNEGRRKIIKLGKNLKDRYKNFLGTSLNLENIDPWSSIVPRTKTSLLLVLKELISDEVNESHLNHLDIYEDKIFLSYITSTYKNSFSKSNKTSQSLKNYLEKHQELLNHLKKHAGVEIDSTCGPHRVYDLLITQKCLGKPQPNWVNEINWENFEELISKHYSEMMVATDELKNNLAGRMLEKIIKDTKEKITNGNDKKIHIYSGHDVNIAGMLGILELSYDHIPQYGACIIFEVHKINDNYEIKIFYCEEPEKEFEIKTSSKNGPKNWSLEELDLFLNPNYLL